MATIGCRSARRVRHGTDNPADSVSKCRRRIGRAVGRAVSRRSTFAVVAVMTTGVEGCPAEPPLYAGCPSSFSTTQRGRTHVSFNSGAARATLGELAEAHSSASLP